MGVTRSSIPLDFDDKEFNAARRSPSLMSLKSKVFKSRGLNGGLQMWLENVSVRGVAYADMDT